MELFVFALYFFFNFSGFSDVAIGSARLYGFRLKPNFDNPYMKTNPQAFWNSWHMSLTRFAQRNVFVPLGGMRPQHQYRAIFATIMVIALWHDLPRARGLRPVPRRRADPPSAVGGTASAPGRTRPGPSERAPGSPSSCST